jgi:hypothetical protein
VCNQRLRALLQKEMTRKDFLGFTGLAVISLFGIVRVVDELLTHAATPYSSADAENGTLSGVATVEDSSTASSGKAVQFGSTPQTGPLIIGYGGSLANIAYLESFTGVTYSTIHVYCDASPDWPNFNTNEMYFLQESGQRYDLWVAAQPGRNLLISPGMIPSSASETQTVTSLGCLAGTGTGTFTVGTFDPSWPTTGNFVLQIGSEEIEVNSAGSTTIAVLSRGYGGSTAATHTGTPTVSIDWRVQGAAGDFNQYWLTWGKRLVSSGIPNAIVRIGHECNGPYERHFVGNLASQQANWALYYQQIVTTLRSISGANFTFEFNVNAGYLPLDQSGYYPGNAYVDYVGIDQYDGLYDGYSGAAGEQWQKILNGQGVVGLASVMAFATSNDKPLAISEWGLAPVNSNGSGFGDDPNYITQMGNIFQGIAPQYWTGGALPKVAYQALFNPLSATTASDGTITITSSAPSAIEDNPNSSAIFRNLFGLHGSGTIPTITSFAPPTATVVQAYSYTLQASGTTPLSFVVTYQTLPPGLSLSSNGLISGTPTKTGTYEFIVTATNMAGIGASPALTITVSS